MNGNYLIIIVTTCIILPLALMKHLGEPFHLAGLKMQYCRFFSDNNQSCLPALKHLHELTFLHSVGYLGYTSGFSLSCMVFFLSAVSCLNIE